MGEEIEDIEEQLLLFVEDNSADPKAIMQQLLDSDSSLSSRKMADWLMKPGISEMLIKFVTRTMDGRELSQSLDMDSAEFFYSSDRRREALLERVPATEESDSEDDMGLQFTAEAKRADKAAEVLANHITSFLPDFIESRLPSLVKELFQIFEVKAEGDFDNFCKVFENLFSKYSSRIVNLLSAQENSRLVLHFLNYLHDPAISENLMLIMKPMLPEQFIVNFYNSLNASGFFTFLGQKIYSEKGRSSSEEASEFFCKLVDNCSTFNYADILFSELGRDFTFVDGLVNGITGVNTPKEQQIACINALRALVIKSGEQLFDQSIELYTQTPLPNMLRGVRAPLHQYLKSKIYALSEKILRDADNRSRVIDTGSSSTSATPNTNNSLNIAERRYPTYVVKHPISMSTMSLLEILVELAEENPKDIFDAWHKQIWRVLVNWCFENCFNNVYHSLFYKLFLTVMRSNHTESMKFMLSKYKFVSKLIDHYMTTKQFTSGFRGYIVKIMNYLRLVSETQAPGDYLRNFLNSHDAWKEFLPVLRDETFGQLVTDYPPPIHAGPLNPFIQHDFSSFASAKPLKPLTRDDISIDLGSKYANGLGLEGHSPHVPQAAQKKKKRNKKNKSGGGKQSGEGTSNGGTKTNENNKAVASKGGVTNAQQNGVPEKSTQAQATKSTSAAGSEQKRGSAETNHST